MTHLTKQELQHLAKLSAIKITPQEEEKLLPQLEKIIDFVGHLQECDTEIPDTFETDTHRLRCNEGVVNSTIKDGFLKNVNHPIHRDMIVLETSTNEN